MRTTPLIVLALVVAARAEADLTAASAQSSSGAPVVALTMLAEGVKHVEFVLYAGGRAMYRAQTTSTDVWRASDIVSVMLTADERRALATASGGGVEPGDGTPPEMTKIWKRLAGTRQPARVRRRQPMTKAHI